jgi:hypothetical protein
MTTRSALRRFGLVASAAIGLVIADSAVAAPPSGGALPSQFMRVLRIAGEGDVPRDAEGVALNVTVTNPSTAGYVTVHPCLDDPPLVSNVNFVADQTVPNFVVAGLDVDGDVCITTSALTDLVVDIAGYVPAGSPVVPLAEPQRFLDTREGIGAPRARVAAGQVLAVALAGVRGVPGDAGTVVFNATVVNPAGPGFVTVFPCGQPVPATSTVNVVGGDVVPNLTVAGIGVGGSVCFYSTVATDLVADVAAYLPAGAAGVATLPAPQRLVDTRIGLGGPAAPVGGSGGSGGALRVVQVGGVAGVPAGASAVLVNLTATEGSANGFAAAFPCGGGVPFVSNLNFARDQNVANGALVKLAPDGTLCLHANVPVHLIVDVTGYVIGSAAMVPVTPTRLDDTREGLEPTCDLGIESIRPSWIDPLVFHRVRDARTGAVRPGFALPPANEARAFVMADCSVMMVGTPVGEIVPRVWTFAPTGELVAQQYALGSDIHSRKRFPAVASGETLFEIRPPNGLVAGPLRPHEVIRIDTGEVVFALPDLPSRPDGSLRLWHLMSVSDSGAVFALRAPSAEPMVHNDWMVTLFAADGEQLAVVELPTGEVPIALSPRVTYLLSTAGDEVRVRSTNGDLITSTTPFGPEFPRSLVPPGWWSEGVVHLCHPMGAGLHRWELFNPVRAFPGSVVGPMPCLSDVG